MKVVMCVGTWPENNYTDFIVHVVMAGESYKDAIERAEKAYGKDNQFYITDIKEEKNAWC